MESLSSAVLVFREWPSQSVLFVKIRSIKVSTFAAEYLSRSFKSLIFDGKGTAVITSLNITTIVSNAKKVYVLFAILIIILITKRSCLIRFTRNQKPISIKISIISKKKIDNKSKTCKIKFKMQIKRFIN